MECPVCRAAAKNASPPTYNGLVVDCRGCGIYRVTKGALDKLLDLRIETRLAALGGRRHRGILRTDGRSGNL